MAVITDKIVIFLEHLTFLHLKPQVLSHLQTLEEYQTEVWGKCFQVSDLLYTLA